MFPEFWWGLGWFLVACGIAGLYVDLLSVDLDGNATVLRRAQSQWHAFPVTSPDGRYLAFSSMPFHGNAWLITGFS